MGNSLAIRLPAIVVEALDLKEGQDVDIQAGGPGSLKIEKKSGNKERIARLRKYRGLMPADFQWDRLEAAERSTGNRMSASGSGFVDTNVLLHLFSTDTEKAERASELPESESVVSVQVLSEFTAVARRKWKVDWRKIDDIVATVLEICRIQALTLGTHWNAGRVAERYRLPWYDAMIAASALEADCTRLFSEDFQHGQVLDRKLELVNPLG